MFQMLSEIIGCQLAVPIVHLVLVVCHFVGRCMPQEIDPGLDVPPRNPEDDWLTLSPWLLVGLTQVLGELGFSSACWLSVRVHEQKQRALHLSIAVGPNLGRVSAEHVVKRRALATRRHVGGNLIRPPSTRKEAAESELIILEALAEHHYAHAPAAHSSHPREISSETGNPESSPGTDRTRTGPPRSRSRRMPFEEARRSIRPGLWEMRIA